MRTVNKKIPAIPSPTKDNDSMYLTIVAVKNALDTILGHSPKLDSRNTTEFKYISQSQFDEELQKIEARLYKLENP